jgi:3-hydroxymyristoyl/3-hydroxydecanoyl-(acyl carrier protein) dehydratase
MLREYLPLFFCDHYFDTPPTPESPALFLGSLEMEQMFRRKDKVFSRGGVKASGIFWEIEQQMISPEIQGILLFFGEALFGEGSHLGVAAIPPGHDVEIPEGSLLEHCPGFPVSGKAGQIERSFQLAGAMTFEKEGHSRSLQKQKDSIVSREIRKISVPGHSGHADAPEKIRFPRRVGRIKFRGAPLAVFPGAYSKIFRGVERIRRHDVFS